MAARALKLTVRRRGETVAVLTAEADPGDMAALQQLLVDAMARDGKPVERIGEYEMDVALATDPSRRLSTFVAMRRR